MQGFSEAQALAQRAVEALRRGDARGARTQFERAVATGQADASIYLGLAIACDNLDDADAAGRALDQALEREPRNLRVLILRGDILDRKGDHRAAASFYQSALQSAPQTGQLPQDLTNGLQRAQAALQRYAGEYESYLRKQMAEAGFDEAHVSNRFGQSLDMMFGKKQIYLQQPKFYYFPGLPQIQFYEREDFPWLDAVEAATDAIRSELLEVMKEDGAFRPYVEANPDRPYSDQMGMLDNPDWGAFYLWKNGTLQADNAARCPRTMEALKDAPLARVEGRTPTVLFSLLRPGTKLPPHHGFINTRLICHLPLIVPEGCGFRVGNETRAWQEGKAWVFDDTIEHEAWNNSDQTRVILLFDIWRPELKPAEREMVSSMFAAIDAYGGKSTDWNV